MIFLPLNMAVLRNTLIVLVSRILLNGLPQLTPSSGRTGRIGNEGLATSFYNERDSDLAETLVKTLLETHQLIPDFLQDYIPEGFTADGEGNPDLLKFEADSDNGEGDENGDASADAGGGWGAPDNSAPVAASGWGQPAAAPAPAASAWGQPAEAPAPVSSGWGAPQAPPAPPVQPEQPAASSGWIAAQAPSHLPPAQPVASSGWGSTPAAPVPVSQAAPAKPVVAGGWGNPSGADAWGSANAGNTGNTGWGATSGGGW
jgi:ATP-dependent RNA helicase DDX3X